MFNWENERADLQLERDRALGTIADNKAKNFDKPYKEAEFNPNGVNLSEIIRGMIERGKTEGFYYIENINYDLDPTEIEELLCIECILPEGWDTPITEVEQINISICYPSQSEIQIMIELFESNLLD